MYKTTEKICQWVAGNSAQSLGIKQRRARQTRIAQSLGTPHQVTIWRQVGALAWEPLPDTHRHSHLSRQSCSGTGQGGKKVELLKAKMAKCTSAGSCYSPGEGNSRTETALKTELEMQLAVPTNPDFIFYCTFLNQDICLLLSKN